MGKECKPKLEDENELDLLPFILRLNNRLGRIMYKIDNGIDLTIDEEDLIRELYICYREHNLETLKKFNDGKKRKIEFESGDFDD
jgi:hypothetical protein